MGTRREEEDERVLKLFYEASEQPKKSFREEMNELLASMDKWEEIFPRPIYVTAGVCYLCCDLMPEPPDDKKELTLSDVVCDGCKEAGFFG